MKNGVDRPPTSGPNPNRASIPVTFIPTKPDKGLPENDSVLAVTLLILTERLATHRLTSSNREKINRSAFTGFSPPYDRLYA
jgi:hypothetical protein